MGIFKNDLSLDKQRVNLLIFGQAKIGKTRSVLDVAAKEDYVLIISTDHGTLEAYKNKDRYKGHLVIAEAYGLKDIRVALEEAKVKVQRIIKQGVTPSKIWMVMDTTTHLQIILLTEARKISLRKPNTEELDDRTFERDLITEVDWGINLTLMSEVASSINELPCNVVNICLEKEDTVGRVRKPAPALSGQSARRFLGDADAILRMAQDEDGQRYFMTTVLDGGGDRSGSLGEMEPVDLIAIRQKMFGRKPDKEKTTNKGEQ